MDRTEARLSLSSSLTVPLVEGGPADGVPVVLLHGATDSWRSFERVWPLLPKTVRVIAFTQRGHGDADKPLDGYSVDALAANVVAVLDALELPAAILVGHSMGSAVALRVAATDPERVRGLALIGAFASLHDNPGVIELWEGVVSSLEDPVDEGFIREFQRSTLGAEVPADFFEMVVGESQKLPARVWQALFAGFLASDLRPSLAAVRAPTMVLWGDADGFCSREEQDRLLAAVPSASLKAYAGGGHALHWEQPERVADDLSAFIDRVVGSGR
jgi:non-heme chloroperoxidase